MPYSTVQRTCDGCHHQNTWPRTEPRGAGYSSCATCLGGGELGQASLNHPTTPIALTGVHSSTLVQCAVPHRCSPPCSAPPTVPPRQFDDHGPEPRDGQLLVPAQLPASWQGGHRPNSAHDGGVSRIRISGSTSASGALRRSPARPAIRLHPVASVPELSRDVQMDPPRDNYTDGLRRSGCHANGSSRECGARQFRFRGPWRGCSSWPAPPSRAAAQEPAGDQPPTRPCSQGGRSSAAGSGGQRSERRWIG
jgi:hypothetical protein